MGAFSLALIFGKIVQVTNHFDYPLYVLALCCLRVPALVGYRSGKAIPQTESDK
jgi:hypothetical protein